MNPLWRSWCMTYTYWNSWNVREHGILLPDFNIKSFKARVIPWYLTHCCGLEVQKLTQALKSVKYPGNTFDVNPPKWERTLPSVGNFSWNIYRVLPKNNPNIKVDIWHPAVGLRCRNSLGVYIKGIAWAFSWLKCLGVFFLP